FIPLNIPPKFLFICQRKKKQKRFSSKLIYVLIFPNKMNFGHSLYKVSTFITPKINKFGNVTSWKETSLRSVLNLHKRNNFSTLTSEMRRSIRKSNLVSFSFSFFFFLVLII